jgi:hypothetical protein
MPIKKAEFVKLLKMKTSSAYLLVLPFRKRTVDGSSKVLVGCVTLGPVVQNRHGYTFILFKKKYPELHNAY